MKMNQHLRKDLKNYFNDLQSFEVFLNEVYTVAQIHVDTVNWIVGVQIHL